jgi:hypothetical protein
VQSGAQWNAMQNAMQRNATQCNAMQRNATQCNGMQRNATQCNAMQRNGTQCKVECNAKRSGMQTERNT